MKKKKENTMTKMALIQLQYILIQGYIRIEFRNVLHLYYNIMTFQKSF